MSEGKQIDWSKAPEGATHFTPKRDDSGAWCDVFWRFEEGKAVEAWRIERDCSLTHIANPSITDDIYERAAQRPASWTGKGMPPAGCEIEYHSPSRGWVRGEYIGQFSGKMVVGCMETGVIGYCPADIVRPIRTPEQIAAEERQKAIDEMWGYLRTDEYEEVRIQRRACADLYDAGYRKAKGES